MSDSNRNINDELLQAAKAGDTDEVKRLINERADVNAEDTNKSTPLHFAAENGHKEIVDALLDKGANVNAESFNRMTPLHFCC